MRNWDSAGLGIVAFATTMAVATTAGIFAAKEFDSGLPTLTTVLATALVAFSLSAYLAVVTFGLNALLADSQEAQRKQIVRAAYGAFAQAYTAALAAVIVIVFPFLEPHLERILW